MSPEDGFEDADELDEGIAQTPSCQDPRDGDSFWEDPPPLNIPICELDLEESPKVGTADLELRRADDKGRLLGDRMAMRGERIIYEIPVHTAPTESTYPHRLVIPDPYATLVLCSYGRNFTVDYIPAKL